MKKPTLRVTKWLGDIPVEAQCTHCPSVSFKAQGGSHRPNREEYQKSLERQFDVHSKAVHSRVLMDGQACSSEQ
ncbi:MAG TPA: hypothetical protein VJQ54_11845 [Candidatus Sulfotelmatobacter sp.]|nr:hypothetical protein [Candidatus Sulfotelmatobacter sp.]